VSTPSPRREGPPKPAPVARGGPNTGFQDALCVLVRLLQRGGVAREEVEEVIRTNCRRQGRPAPAGPSMQRRMERLRVTFEESGVVIEPLVLVGHDTSGRPSGWRVPRRVRQRVKL
jgi:hypothetical protein